MKKFFLMLTVLFTALAANADNWELVKSIDYATSSWTGWNNGNFPREGDAMVVKNEAKKGANYELQYHGLDGVEIAEGETYKLVLTVEGDGEGYIACAVCDWGHNGSNNKNVNFNKEKKTYEYEFTSPFTASCFVMMQSGDYVGTYKVYDVAVYHKVLGRKIDIVSFPMDVTAAEHVAKVYNNQFSNVSDAENEITVVSPAKVELDWDTQFWFVMKEKLAADAKVQLTFDAKASSAQSLGFGAHGTPDGNDWKSGGVADNANVTTDWQSFTRNINAKAGWQSFAVDLTKATEVTYSFKNIKLAVAQTIEMGEAQGNASASRFKGLTINFPKNNVAAVAGNEFAGTLNCLTAQLQMGEDVVATAKNVQGTAEAITLFADQKLEPSTEYTVVIAATDLTLNAGEEYYWTNKKDLAVKFTTKAVYEDAPALVYSKVLPTSEAPAYLYNVETATFLYKGNDWGTRASVDKTNALLVATEANDNTYKLLNITGKSAFDCDGSKNSWVDGGTRTGYNAWSFVELGNDTYEIQNANAAGLKWGAKLDLSDTRVIFNEGDGFGNTWAFINPEENADFFAYLEAAKQKALDDANKVNLAAKQALIEGTNIYEEDGYNDYVAQYEEEKAAVEDGGYTGTVLNPTKATGWHSSTDYNFLLTPWTIAGQQANKFDKGLYINTWSVEGDTDGSNFTVPFFEYWTGDDGKLGATTLATVVSDCEEATYEVTARVRVRLSNPANKNGEDAKGITLAAGQGEPVNVCEGDAFGQMRVMKAVAQGAPDEEGNLTVAFEVAADNNISWLSFKDVYVQKTEIPVAIDQISSAKNQKVGKFMQNGKIVIVKNGKTFNVAGARIK